MSLWLCRWRSRKRDVRPSGRTLPVLRSGGLPGARQDPISRKRGPGSELYRDHSLLRKNRDHAESAAKQLRLSHLFELASWAIVICAPGLPSSRGLVRVLRGATDSHGHVDA